MKKLLLIPVLLSTFILAGCSSLGTLTEEERLKSNGIQIDICKSNSGMKLVSNKNFVDGYLYYCAPVK